ncbi:MAG: hypothetical protein B6U95_08930 [Thermofilum sp. ex4484_82]|nr:hypothetical protein [Thermoproteales archaeon]OYT25594.1 MAG: hypothetical protein B6U95_08930 [Thermofilum sp. ex4484_82]OYT36091.1 MAG: hypothetical protein B6U96_08935 [Archaeoglobales archaeon ex4484_92]RLE76850.1 MAG: hypothetical protein DRJ44_03320 [Thermoprotei archaeon]
MLKLKFLIGRKIGEADKYKEIIKQIVEAEKNISKPIDVEVDIFKMLEYSLKYKALARKIRKNGKWVWIVEIES